MVIKSKKNKYSKPNLKDLGSYLSFEKKKIADLISNNKKIKIFLILGALSVLFVFFWFSRNLISDQYYMLAVKSESVGDSSKAVMLAQRAIKIFPQDSDCWRLIGEIKSKQATANIKNAIHSHSSQEEINQILKIDVGSALFYLQKAVEIDPNDWQNQYSLGVFYEMLIGYVPEAEKQASFSYIHAAELNPDVLYIQIAALRNIIFYADSLESEGNNNEKIQALLLAQNILNKIKSRHLSDDIYHFYNGLILLRVKQYNLSIDELRLAATIFPDNAYLLYQTGLAYFAKGDIQNARTFFLLKIVQNSVYAGSANELVAKLDTK